MTRSLRSDDALIVAPPRRPRWQRWLVLGGVPALLALILLWILGALFLRYVPPGKMLVIVAKDGSPLEEGQVLAEKGQKGIQREVLGEGWHIVFPIVYSTELHENIFVP